MPQLRAEAIFKNLPPTLHKGQEGKRNRKWHKPQFYEDFSLSLEITRSTAPYPHRGQSYCVLDGKKKSEGYRGREFPYRTRHTEVFLFPNFNCLRVVAFHTRKFLNSECSFYRFESGGTQNPPFISDPASGAVTCTPR